MRHRVQTKQLGRNTKQRQALFKSLVRELVLHGAITTTQAKAKTVRPIADKLIGKALTNDVNTRRLLHQFFGKRDIVNTLVDRIAPAFTKRTSGFTRITPVGIRRGDNTQMVRLELINKPDVVDTLRNPAKVESDKTVKETKQTKTAKSKKEAAKPAKKSVAQKAVKTVAATTDAKTTARKSTTTKSVAASKKK